jgi:hypothetical protein
LFDPVPETQTLLADEVEEEEVLDEVEELVALGVVRGLMVVDVGLVVLVDDFEGVVGLVEPEQVVDLVLLLVGFIGEELWLRDDDEVGFVERDDVVDGEDIDPIPSIEPT